MAAQNFIVMDWGSTNIRAFLYVDGEQKEIRKSAEGVTVVTGAACEGAFDRLTADWFATYGPMPVVMAGMVGSVNGWADAAYLDCPVDLGQLLSRLTEVRHQKGYTIRIIPGLCVRDPDNYNVIRGEETQLLGAISQHPGKVFLMPGTHCKWVLADGMVIKSFRTAMTGELHSIIMKHSLVGAGAPEQTGSPETFREGLRRGYSENNILPRLFEIRGARILGGIRPEHSAELLSGLLIGAEVAAMQKIFRFGSADGPITIIANPALTARYQEALQLAGLECRSMEGDEAFLGGMLPLARALI